MELLSEAERLLQRCQQGDEAALAEFMRIYQRRIFQFTLRVSRDPSVAEEATVDCFYRVWTKCRQRRDEASLDAWVFRIALRAVLDVTRKQQRWWRRLIAGSRSTEHDPQPGPLENLIETEQQQRLANELSSAIETLKEEDRVLVHLYYFEGRNLTEIAAVLDSSSETLKMRLLRVRKRLGTLLESMNWEANDGET